MIPTGLSLESRDHLKRQMRVIASALVEPTISD
jgi:hypothetical protein